MDTQNTDLLCMGCFTQLQTSGIVCTVCGYDPGLPADSLYMQRSAIFGRPEQPSAPPQPEWYAVRSVPHPSYPPPPYPARNGGYPPAATKPTSNKIKIIAAAVAACLVIGLIIVLSTMLSAPPDNGAETRDDRMSGDAPSTPSASVSAGETITFGGNDWLVLEVSDGKALLLSEGIIEKRPYHRTYADITWKGSDLREYLNGEYYNSFAPEDRERIAETLVTNADNPWFGTPGGNDTTDRIFLLSLDELVQYFGDSGQLGDQ